MRDQIAQFMREFDYPGEAQSSLLQAWDVIRDHKKDEIFYRLVEEYRQQEDCDIRQLLKKAGDLGEFCGVSPYQTHLLLLMAMAGHLKERYKKNGYSMELWKESLMDLKYKLWECEKVKGIWGNFVADWEIGFFKLDRFAFGRLQFEPRFFKGDSYTRKGVTIKKGDPVLNVHIPRSLTPLDRASCQQAYERAVEFYRPWFGQQPVAFVIYSWLLYPGYQELFPENSNIRRFNRDYTVVLTTEEEDPRDNLWRLFDMDWTGNVKDYPEDSSVRRNMKRYLEGGGKIGSAYAIYLPPAEEQAHKK